MIENIRIIASFAGTGKSTLAKLHPEFFIDFPIMPHKYFLEPTENPDDERHKANPNNKMNIEYPFNYVEALIELLSAEEHKTKTILIPSDTRILHLLKNENIPFLLCYPQRNAKEIYYKRYLNRGNTEDFIRIFIEHWDDWFLDLLENDPCPCKIILQPHEFLSDVIDLETLKNI